jgi:hypothetical protein
MSGSGPSRVVTKEAVWRVEGAMDKRGQERGEVDEAVVPAVQGQRGAAAPVRPGLQPGHLPAAAGTAQADQGLDADDAAGEAGQDRGQAGQPLQVRPLSAGGGGGAPPAVCGDFGADRSAAAGVRLGVRFAARDKTVRTSFPCVRGAPLGRISGDESRRSVWCAGLGPRRGGYRRRFLGKNRCNRPFGWVTSAAGVAATAPAVFIWERSV